MISRNAKIFCVALFVLICVVNAFAYGLHLFPQDYQHHGLCYHLWAYVTLPMGLPVVWGILWLMMRLCCGGKALDPAYVEFLSACVIACSVMVFCTDLYLFFYMPLVFGHFDAVGYNRLQLVLSGLLLVGLGNVTPKLPYQPLRSWLEIGPERTYRVNRLGGWLMVAMGLVQAGIALALPLSHRAFETAFVLTVAVLLIPYTWVYAANVRAYRRAGGVA